MGARYRLVINILIVTNTRFGGGTEKHINAIMVGLRERGARIEVAYLGEAGLWGVCRIIRGGKFDIVHCFLPRAYLLASIACELTGQRRRIMSRRSLAKSYQTPAVRLVERLLHKRTGILVGNSPAVVRELEAEAPNADIRLIRNCAEVKPTKHSACRAFTMICVCNAYPYKGHDDLFRALEQIRGRLQRPWLLLLVGRGTERIDRPNIIGLGYRSDVSDLLARADLFILPSHAEGSSNALLEAMAAGVPVIATDVGGNKDTVINGITGLLVPPKSPKDLAAAILQMTDAERRQPLARMAQLDVAIRFPPDQTINDYADLYRSAISMSGG